MVHYIDREPLTCSVPHHFIVWRVYRVTPPSLPVEKNKTFWHFYLWTTGMMWRIKFTLAIICLPEALKKITIYCIRDQKGRKKNYLYQKKNGSFNISCTTEKYCSIGHLQPSTEPNIWPADKWDINWTVKMCFVNHR